MSHYANINYYRHIHACTDRAMEIRRCNVAGSKKRNYKVPSLLPYLVLKLLLNKIEVIVDERRFTSVYIG